MLTMGKDKEKKLYRHQLPGLILRLPTEYRERLRQSAKKNRRTMTEEAKIAFEEYLKSQGLWPPDPQSL